MKIYMRYSVGKCRCLCSKKKDCSYIGYDYDYHEECGYYAPGEEYNCFYYYEAERVIAKEIKNLEIDEEYVKIGRQKYDLRDVEVLKVDYGDGFVTEYGEEDTAKL